MKLFLYFLALVAIFGIFSGSAEPVVSFLRGNKIESTLHALHNGNSIFFNLSVGFLSSFIFWLLVVQYPECKRRALLRDNLALQYQNFKESVIRIFLNCSNVSRDSEFQKSLSNHLEFKKFFSGNNWQNWYDVQNGLQDQIHHMHDLLFELELLASEVAYVLNNVSIQDPKVHHSLKFLNEHIFRLKNSSVYYNDPAKYVSNFLYGILARWSFNDGPRQDDYIKELIKKL